MYTILGLIIESNLDWSKLESVCTDGASAMTGKRSGCVSLLKGFVGHAVLAFHCIIHQESLCAKILNFSHVVEPVIQCINKIHAQPLHRRQFCTLFPEKTDDENEFLLHCSVRWLSRGKALERFWTLRHKILVFLEEKGELSETCDLLKDRVWLCDLAFMVDITGHLNKIGSWSQYTYTTHTRASVSVFVHRSAEDESDTARSFSTPKVKKLKMDNVSKTQWTRRIAYTYIYIFST